MHTFNRVALTTLLFALPAAAQHEAHGTHSPDMAMPAMNMPNAQGMMMASTINLNDPMSRESSGTAWQPDSSPIYAAMKMKGNKMFMLHGDIFPRYTTIGGDRDASIAGKGSNSRFDAPSMFMGMFSQPVGKNGQLGLHLMTSLDPLIERGYGYPLLYQSGESFGGEPLHDRQHPHDFISELSATYSRGLGGNKSAYLYLGLPGEPALGPPTFMHRTSGMDIADAPISHHWQDSTHITFGVVTAGISSGNLKFEASTFKGEEPDENRYNIDTPRLDSFSGRVSWNPTRDLALQVSHGFVKHPEALEPDVSLHRTTASLIFQQAFGPRCQLGQYFRVGPEYHRRRGAQQLIPIRDQLPKTRRHILRALRARAKIGIRIGFIAAQHREIIRRWRLLGRLYP